MPKIYDFFRFFIFYHSKFDVGRSMFDVQIVNWPYHGKFHMRCQHLSVGSRNCLASIIAHGVDNNGKIPIRVAIRIKYSVQQERDAIHRECPLGNAFHDH